MRITIIQSTIESRYEYTYRCTRCSHHQLAQIEVRGNGSATLFHADGTSERRAAENAVQLGIDTMAFVPCPRCGETDGKLARGVRVKFYAGVLRHCALVTLLFLAVSALMGSLNTTTLAIMAGGVVLGAAIVIGQSLKPWSKVGERVAFLPESAGDSEAPTSGGGDEPVQQIDNALPTPRERPVSDPLERELSRIRDRRKRNHRIRLSVAAALPLFAVAWFAQRALAPHLFDESFELTDAQRQQGRDAVAKARAKSEALQKAFMPAIVAAEKELGPRSDLGPCPYELIERRPMQKGDAYRHMSDASAFPSMLSKPSEVHLLKADGGLRGEADSVENALDRVWYHADGPVDAQRDIEALMTLQPPRAFVVVIVEQSRVAARQEAETFVPGHIRARTFLYEFSSGQVVCAADVEATSSDLVSFEYVRYGAGNSTETTAGSRALADDLIIELERAVARSMKFAAGPRRTKPSLEETDAERDGRDFGTEPSL